eukprot:6960993-Lingulodinium_polyedra.AAC.1
MTTSGPKQDTPPGPRGICHGSTCAPGAHGSGHGARPNAFAPFASCVPDAYRSCHGAQPIAFTPF